MGIIGACQKFNATIDEYGANPQEALEGILTTSDWDASPMIISDAEGGIVAIPQGEDIELQRGKGREMLDIMDSLLQYCAIGVLRGSTLRAARICLSQENPTLLIGDFSKAKEYQEKLIEELEKIKQMVIMLPGLGIPMFMVTEIAVFYLPTGLWTSIGSSLSLGSMVALRVRLSRLIKKIKSGNVLAFEEDKSLLEVERAVKDAQSNTGRAIRRIEDIGSTGGEGEILPKYKHVAKLVETGKHPYLHITERMKIGMALEIRRLEKISEKA